MDITLQPGDVIATGTPYGTGMATKTWLKEDDIVEISILPLGILRCPVASPMVPPFPATSSSRVPAETIARLSKALSLRSRSRDFVTNSRLFYWTWKDMAKALSVKAPGLSITGFAQDGQGVAMSFAAMYPDMARNVLHCTITEIKSKAPGIREQVGQAAALARNLGMPSIAKILAPLGLSRVTLSSRPLFKAFVEQSFSYSPQRYILACQAMAAAPDTDFSSIKTETVVIVAGREDQVIPEEMIDFAESSIDGAKPIWMEDVGHWHQ
ncbi:hypothetical protein M422DRAFT_244918 [Sphaerobolus stellatus SS14]|nr:hypothetical protein M422DRAFT_244918 [Sphaerobolus stellatus SS14]